MPKTLVKFEWQRRQNSAIYRWDMLKSPIFDQLLAIWVSGLSYDVDCVILRLSVLIDFWPTDRQTHDDSIYRASFAVAR